MSGVDVRAVTARRWLEEQFVPTANPAASGQPQMPPQIPMKPRTRRGPRFYKALAVLLALPIAASFSAAAPQSVAGRGGPSCSSHASLTHPPDSIRVLRRQSGRIEAVNFRKYVVTVMGKEWPSYLPQSVVEAGAVAVKQYAWYHTVYTSRSSDGRCFDVRDGISDQLYKPNRSRIRPDHYRALDATWNVTLRKSGRFFMTGYRRGDKVRCGRDVTGYKLYARSATECARKGHGWQQILRTYYGPGLELVGGRGGSGSSTQATDSQAPDGSTSTAPAPAAPASPAPASGEVVAGSSAQRLGNGRWAGRSPGGVVQGAGFFGSTIGGLGAALGRESGGAAVL